MRTRTPTDPPTPPPWLPRARTVRLPDRGELFVRDTALERAPADGAPTVLLLHGWVVTADLNWHTAYEPLADVGYRVLALDHRGHGRGLRAVVPFRLTDCAADAAALLRTLDTGPALVVGYSMGGAIAQLMARDHADVVGGVVYTATAQHFQDPKDARVWRLMGVLGLLISLAPRALFGVGMRRSGVPGGRMAAWTIGELLRHQAGDIAEAGRELGRFDSRPWLANVSVPSAMALTSRDTAVSPAKQHELADACGATAAGRVHEAPIDHMQPTTHADVYNPALLAAIADLVPAAGAPGQR